ncbi:glycosyltransferase family 4 protein [Domibacillus sp. A3M-37]|uniref:glycosyltransferase family 4 protein n=1 Tax=Domibacillus sp. A3M-37 TaxID=2962037 RepID=UPI0020B7D9EA|nr:glycosyltransferase family 1 protein [Domibacillus sp. A3M-37]MCP3761376.1 glycosyltransferase family 4 protein [Domibacillus sp. A3M-37]
MNKRIYINGRFLTQKTTGVQRVAEEFVKEIDKQMENYTLKQKSLFTLLVPKGDYKELGLKNIEVKEVGFFKGHLWEQVTLSFLARSNLLINFCNTGPIFKRNQVVFIHDAAICAAPDGFSKNFIRWYKILYKNFARFSTRIFTVSEFSRDELIKYFPKLHNKITVINNGVNHVLDVQSDEKILKKYGIESKSFILAVSSLNPNKNFKIIHKAISKMDDFNGQVIIVGGKQANVFANEDLQTHSNIKWVGYVTDEELVCLYKNARFFVFPSIYEGFGLPPLEAMTFGCPVIASNHECIKEICEDQVIYFNPLDESDLIGKIMELYHNDKLVDQMSKKGVKFTSKYNWTNSTEKLLNYIQTLM